MSDSTVNGSPPASGGRGKKRAPKPKAGETGADRSSKDVGRALRSVYDTTLGERVPDDFLDLLGKLS